MKKICKICNNEYVTKTKKTSYFCSLPCQRKDYSNRKKEGLTYKPLDKKCESCSTIFTSLLPQSKYCSDKCKSINKKKVNVGNNKDYRKQFRDKYGLPSSREFAEFIHHQYLLDSNPVLLQALQTIHKIKQTKGKKIPDDVRKANKLMWERAYHGRPIDGYGIVRCPICDKEFVKKRDNHKVCSLPCNRKYYK